MNKFYNKCRMLEVIALGILCMTSPAEAMAWIVLAEMFVLLFGFDFIEEVGL